jgi:cytochrome P450
VAATGNFRPVGFLPGAPAPDRFAYLPLGVGSRVCIGAQFALTEATLVLATMINAFHMSASPPSRDPGRDRHHSARSLLVFPLSAKVL